MREEIIKRKELLEFIARVGEHAEGMRDVRKFVAIRFKSTHVNAVLNELIKERAIVPLRFHGYGLSRKAWDELSGVKR